MAKVCSHTGMKIDSEDGEPVEFRICVTINRGLLTVLDDHAQGRHVSRSKAVRDALRLALNVEAPARAKPTASITLERPRAPVPRQVA